MSTTINSASKEKDNALIPIIIIALLFFIFGFATWINGALIPFMKTINELTTAQSYLVASASYISFVAMALPASYIINKIGYRKGMSIGLFVMALGALVYIPVAEARTYWVFLTGIFIQGMVMTFLQTASNPYITILGPIESAAKRIAIMGIANALVWPAVWPLTLNGLGKFTKTASALLIMAISGGAIIPPLYGRFFDENKADFIAQGMNDIAASAEAATSGYWILLPCYLIILYYAFAGHKLDLKKNK